MNAMLDQRPFCLVLAALLAASPLAAQTRFGPASKATAGGAAVIGVLSGAPQNAPLAAPAVSIETPGSPAAAEAAASVVSPLDEAARAAQEALSASNIDDLSGEESKAASGTAFGERDGEAVGDVAGVFSAAVPDLEPADRITVEPSREPRAPARTRARPTIAERLHYVRLLAQNYYWYSVTHIVSMWPSYRKSWEEARAKGVANVSHPRSFFSYMRIAGSSGRFNVLGASPSEDDVVIAKFRDVVKRHQGLAKELAAFDDFTERAKAFNSARRAPSNMRKHIRDALLKASTMEPAKLASFFDSLLIGDTARETVDFQTNGGQKRILDAFEQEMLAALAEEPEEKGRVRAAVLLGSFASGSAGPKSDFDVDLLTDGGSRVRVEAFIKRFTDRWIATGHHQRNPVSIHTNPLPPTRAIIDLIHTGDYLVISGEPRLKETLQRKPGEYAPPIIRKDSLRGRINNAIQYGVIFSATYVGDLKARLGMVSSAH